MDYIAKNCASNANKNSALKPLVDRYYAIVNSVNLYGQNQNNATSDYQLVIERDVYYNDSEQTPKYVSLYDLQQAINYLENRFSKNCNCETLPHMCESCQAECTNSTGYQEPLMIGGVDNRSNCYKIGKYRECSYACQTLKCQSVDTTTKSCEGCQSCQSCQLGTTNFSCQSCQQFSCQTQSCQANKPDTGASLPNEQRTLSTVCQTCQKCQSKTMRVSCQTQCH